jgi:hypothetical protein
MCHVMCAERGFYVTYLGAGPLGTRGTLRSVVCVRCGFVRRFEGGMALSCRPPPPHP